MSVVFAEPGVWREQSTWKTIFAEPSITADKSQLFANFGSNIYFDNCPPDVDTLADNIAKRLASDVFTQLHEKSISTSRPIHTSNGLRISFNNRATIPTPTMKQRAIPLNATSVEKTTVTQYMNQKKPVARSRLARAPAYKVALANRI